MKFVKKYIPYHIYMGHNMAKVKRNQTKKYKKKYNKRVIKK